MVKYTEWSFQDIRFKRASKSVTYLLIQTKNINCIRDSIIEAGQETFEICFPSYFVHTTVIPFSIAVLLFGVLSSSGSDFLSSAALR